MAQGRADHGCRIASGKTTWRIRHFR
jgi:hypothetical protein